MHLRRRTAKPYIITHKVINPQQSEENKEQYFYQLLKLFKPWRAEADLCLAGQSYHDTYVNEKQISSRVIDILNRLMRQTGTQPNKSRRRKGQLPNEQKGSQLHKRKRQQLKTVRVYLRAVKLT